MRRRPSNPCGGVDCSRRRMMRQRLRNQARCPGIAPAPGSMMRIGRPMNDEAVRDLARRAGIAVEWNDYAGRPQVVAPDVLQRILDALELPSTTRSDLLDSRKQVSRRASPTTLPPLITATAG